nr:rhamnan synthesis F family protein [Leucothrix mucor]
MKFIQRIRKRFSKKSYEQAPPPSLSNKPDTSDDKNLILDSGLFDADWYQKKYSTKNNLIDAPYEHFLKYGLINENDPSSAFSTRAYYLLYPDVRLSGLNPLVHYLEHGINEGRIFLPVSFDVSKADERLSIKLLKESGLFDVDWYLDTYQDVAKANIDPIAHYVGNGAREGRNPSQSFFSYFYLSQLRNEGLSYINPLLHYIFIGRQNNLRASPDGLRICPALPTGQHYASLPAQTFSIAVMAHIFYDDMLPEFQHWLSNIPFHFDLLISTPSEPQQQRIVEGLASLPNLGTLDVRVMPNQGRDIAPMVVGFAKECLAHDYVLHLHSKKSPYGSETDGWFSYCLSHLLDSPLYVSAILNQFEQNPELGIIYPPPLPTLRNHLHWENMRPEGEALLDRLGVPATTLEAFPLEFPAGSMMWFRSSALRPLFEANLDWADFPAEDSQKNGTLAHVIERLFFYVAHHQQQTYQAVRPASPMEFFSPLIAPTMPEHRDWSVTAKPIVSIIIPVYNQWAHTRACLNAIADFTDPEQTPYEIILADDGSTDETLAAADHYPHLIVVRTPKNLGFLGNCNHAAKTAQGTFLVLLNNDTQVQPGWLSSLIDTFETHPNAAVVGSKLLYPDGSLQEAGGVVWQNAGGLNYGRDQNPALPEYSYLKPSDYISGAAIAVRHDFWLTLGGFDERFVPAYYEDTDLCFEARDHNREVYLQPASLVVHFEGKSHGTDLGSGIKHHQVINQQKFRDKWQTTLETKHVDGSQLLFARERSVGKKIIAVLDYYLPEYDRHAGARHTLTYIKLLLSKGYVVKYFACFIDHERQIQFATQLQQLGVETYYPGIYYFEQNWSAWLTAHKDYLDAVLINRPHIYQMHAKACQEASIPVLYFCHDLHNLRAYREALRQQDTEKAKQVKAREQEEIDIFRQAAFSYTPSQFEADYLQQEHNIETVSYLPLYCNETGCPDRKRAPEGQRIVFVGGMQHAPNHDAVTWFLSEVWPFVIKAAPQASFRLVGANPSESLYAMADESVTLLGGISEDDLHEEYRLARLVVAPLQYGAGVKGKTLEALQKGIPLVATSIAAEGIPGINDLLPTADTPEAFAQQVLEMLALSDEQWLDCSHNYTAFARHTLSTEEAWRHFSRGLNLIGLERE